jgi:hypothetical protein
MRTGHSWGADPLCVPVVACPALALFTVPPKYRGKGTTELNRSFLIRRRKVRLMAQGRAFLTAQPRLEGWNSLTLQNYPDSILNTYKIVSSALLSSLD